MALQLHVSCSNHQKEDGGFGREEEIWIDTIDDKSRDLVHRHLVRRNWIVQFNGEHVDTYCSKKCAK